MIDKIIQNYPDLFYSTGNSEDGSQRMFFKDNEVCESVLKVTTFDYEETGFNIYSDGYFAGMRNSDSLSFVVFGFKYGEIQFSDYKPLADEILLRFYKYGIIFQYFEDVNKWNSPVLDYDIVSVLRRNTIKDIIS